MRARDRRDGEAGLALARPQGCARIHHSLTDRRIDGDQKGELFPVEGVVVF